VKSPKIQPVGPWIMSNHSIKFHKDLISSIWVILLTDRQTDRQTDAGENNLISIVCKAEKNACATVLLVSIRKAVFLDDLWNVVGNFYASATDWPNAYHALGEKIRRACW